MLERDDCCIRAWTSGPQDYPGLNSRTDVIIFTRRFKMLVLGCKAFTLKVKGCCYSLPIPKYSDNFTIFKPLAFITDLNIP